MSRIVGTVALLPDEKDALLTLAESEGVAPPEMVRWLIRTEAQRRGLWLPSPEQEQPQQGVQDEHTK